MHLFSYPVHQAGHPLTGKVTVSTKGPMKADTVKLTIVGKEKTAIRLGGDKRTIEAERPFFTVELPFRDQPHETIRRGKFAFPFSVELPPSLPSTVSYPPSTGRLGLRIQYKMIGSVGTKLHAKHYLNVASAPVPNERVPAMIQPTCFTLNSLGIFKQGTCTLGVSVEDTHVGRGCTLDVHMACRNESTTDIRRINVKLIEALQWNTDPAGYGHQRTKFIELLHLTDVDLPGLAKERKLREQVRKSNPAEQATVFTSIYEDLASGSSKIQLTVPPQARDSYSGQLIKVRHFLEIKLLTGRMTNNPDINVPIRIGNPPQRRSSATRRRPSVPAAVPTAAEPQATPMAPSAPMQPGYCPEAVEAVAEVEGSYGAGASAPYEQADIPIVSAVALSGSTGTIQSPVTHAPQDVIVLGGDAIIVDQDVDLSDLGRPPPPRRQITPPSIESLIRDMVFSVNDYDTIAARLQDPSWIPLFQALSPQEFGTIIAHVNIDFDQPKIAKLLARYINDGRYFTCHYAAQAIKNSSEWNRSTMASDLIPLCIDIDTHQALIRAELSEWELTVTQRDFDNALSRARGRR